MPVSNAEVADIFEEMADLLDIQEANRFRIRAYRNAASMIGRLSRNVRDMVEEGEDLTELSGIGDDLAEKIQEIVATGTLRQLEELEDEVSPDLAKLLRVPGLGPKRVRTLRDELGITTLDELEQAARQEKVQTIKGFGEKIEHNILEGIEEAHGEERRILLMEADQLVEPLVEYMDKCEEADDIVVAGSYRRRKETVGDIDVLVTGDEGADVIDHFKAYEDVVEVLSEGETRSSVVLRSGLHVDLRVVADESCGAALMYFTGSRDHNIAFRNLAVEKDLKVNEYGVFRVDDDEEERIAGATEEEIYHLLDRSYIPPELRENRGELDAAAQDELPELITLEDIRGDLQMHTTASDGKASLEEMVDAARERGYEYIAITDHSKYVGITNGLDEKRLADQIEAIEALNDKHDDIRILKSMEVDVKEDGSLAMSEEMLEALDLVLCAIHSNFDLSEEKQTERLLRAMDNPAVNIVAHPTGRLIGKRAPYAIDVGRVMEGALERGCFLEINAQPDRLDLNDIYAKAAKEMDLKLAISTDAHATTNLDFMHCGVDQARRGWLESDDVLNTRAWTDLKKLLDR